MTKQNIVDVVVPFPHVLIAVLRDVETIELWEYSQAHHYFRVCSTLDLAKQTLAQHKGTGTVEALGIDSDARMVLWGKSIGWRRCPVRHLEQIETEWTP